MDVKQYQHLMTLKYAGASDCDRDQQQRSLVRKDLIPPVNLGDGDEYGLHERGFVFDPTVRNRPHMIVHLAPLHFVHVLDLNTMFVKMLSGPLTFTIAFHERAIYGPKPMLTIPPGHYCVIQHPARRRALASHLRDVPAAAAVSPSADSAAAAPAALGSPLRRSVDAPPTSPAPERRVHANSSAASATTAAASGAASSTSCTPGASGTGSLSGPSTPLHVASQLAAPVGSAYEIQTDQYGQAVIDRNVRQVRTEQPPFPLYPGELLLDASIRPLPFVPEDHALRLRAEVNFVDEQTCAPGQVHRRAAEEWAFRGPRVFVPDSRVRVCGVLSPLLLKPQQGVALEATLDHVDDTGVSRIAGERWLVVREGNVLPGVYQKGV
jgi:Major Vault Protein repeat domain